MPTKQFWLSYDLGVDGDYEGIYRWLDGHRARECGESVASFKFQYKLNPETELKNQLKKAVKLNSRSRVYIVRRIGGRGGKASTVQGSWLVGGRRAAPWAGYSETYDSSDDEE